MRQDHQMTTRLSSDRTMLSPGLHWNACANDGSLDGAPIARKFAGACGSVFRRTFSSSGLKLRRHTVAQLSQKRWFSVEAATLKKNVILASASAFCSASK